TADLDAAGIGWRRWYGRGLHREAYFAGAGTGGAPALPRAEALGDRLIGVPMHEMLTAADIAAVTAVLRRFA
ncbi:DegT/DnrJ/EryC1/StrS family aminotransferase, partial [Acidisphaera rubrifaciens]|uniref:DegT/DnrJ/EryC1/StrS family aminotransferase n=1 Tax=Acidisphaera rubrifaciens TaxID=50715 RepID=UPI000662450D